MADGRQNNGGLRAGAGRRKKNDADDLRGLLRKVAPAAKRESILQKLVEDADSSLSFKVRNEARKILLPYLFGKPVERVEVEGEVDLKMLSPEEFKKRAAERRKQLEALDDSIENKCKVCSRMFFYSYESDTCPQCFGSTSSQK